MNGSRARSLALLIALGLYLTLRGYHSRDGDQAYRLPLLLHQQTPALYANDPFVSAFDAFNPHRGYLALLDLASRPFGLSVALAALFAVTFVATCVAIDRMARETWPGRGAGWVAVGMVLAAKAGNIGTNHLFEAMLLDRLIALAMGWTAIADLLADRPRPLRAAILIGAATVVHPSLGLQLGMLLGAGWLLWPILRTEVTWRDAMAGLGALGAAMVPGVALMAGAGSRLLEGLPADEFFTLSALIQGPQHMIPHLWRMPQWLAWGAYVVLAGIAIATAREGAAPGRRRLMVLLAIDLAALALGWFAVEVVASVRVTVFQPFRMATVARGLCLVLAADRVRGLWDRGDAWARCRAAMLVAGLVGDWAFVIAVAVELGSTLAGQFGKRCEAAVAAGVLGWGVWFVSRHDTESGQWPLLGAAALGLLAPRVAGVGPFVMAKERRVVFLAVACWTLPVLAMVAPERFAATCRFAETPSDDVERLAVWCRANTPESSRFVGPPGPKTFRLWSRREVAFNRAAGPYHAAGLADWAGRFRDHVGFRGTTAEFARAYLANRQRLERGFDAMTDLELADLARRQGADHLIAAAPKSGDRARTGPLELLRVEGRYAAYRVRPPGLASRSAVRPSP